MRGGAWVSQLRGQGQTKVCGPSTAPRLPCLVGVCWAAIGPHSPTLPLSGGKENTVMASFLSRFSFLASLAQLMARLRAAAQGGVRTVKVGEGKRASRHGSK